MNINIKTVLKGIVLSAALPMAAQAQTELKVSTFVPQNDALMQVVEEWANSVTERTDGAVTFAYFPSSQMGPPDRQFDLARTGVADISLIIHGFTPGRFQMTEISYLPGVFAGISSEDGGRVLYSLYDQYMAEEHGGTHLLAIAPTPEAFVFSNVPYADLAAIEGQRVRSAGAAMSDTLLALGAVPVAVPVPEMADALQRGIVDGLGVTYQAITDWQIETIGSDVWDVPIGVVTFGLVMNEEALQALPDDVRAILLEEAGEMMSAAFGRKLDEAEIDAIDAVQSTFAITTPDESSMAEIQAIIDARIESGLDLLEADGKPGRAMFDALTTGLAAVE